MKKSILHSKRIQMIKDLFGLLSIVLLFLGCRAKERFQASNLPHIYDSNKLGLKPEFVVYHLNRQKTRIYYRINSSDLLYVRSSENDNYTASFNIDYYLSPSFENTTVLDSGSYDIKDVEAKPPQKTLIGYFDINTPQIDTEEESLYILHLVMNDENRPLTFENFVRINKNSIANRQNFILLDPDSNIIFKNHIATNTPFRLHYNGNTADKYWVSYYHRDFPLALPPYSNKSSESFELTPDNTYKVPANQSITLSKNGFYHFRLDTNNWDGYTVFSFYNTFPYIAKRVHLGPPLRYLTTSKEYKELTEVMNNSVKIKEKLDRFWLKRAGSIERSRVLVKEFYSRVQEANFHFSSYLEGWKTDRGIIYVIYGPPNKVFRSSTGEIWSYGEEASSLSYRFNFAKAGNPFTENDYSLERMPAYRYGWGQAIQAWRNGHIYNSKAIEQEQNEQDRLQQLQRRPLYWY